MPAMNPGGGPTTATRPAPRGGRPGGVRTPGTRAPGGPGDRRGGRRAGRGLRPRPRHLRTAELAACPPPVRRCSLQSRELLVGIALQTAVVVANPCQLDVRTVRPNDARTRRSDNG